jgi:hypothetical protein
VEDHRLTYAGRHRGRRPADTDFLEHHHGDRYLPRHGEGRYISRCLPRELVWELIIVTT